MLYKEKTIAELDSYYGLGSDSRCLEYKLKDCKKIQQAFSDKGIALTLAECKLVYETYSDERWCAGWSEGIQDMELEEIFKLLFYQLVEIMNDRIDRLNILGDQIVSLGYVNQTE